VRGEGAAVTKWKIKIKMMMMMTMKGAGDKRLRQCTRKAGTAAAPGGA
jgi:hypothetical protein